MREFKFRAWDKERKQLLDVLGIEIMNKQCWVQDYVELDNGNTRLIDFKDCEIMQYTGLKDDKGNEIYEGDILKSDDIIIGKVTYWMGHYVIVNKYDDSNFLSNTIDYNVFIVGNIYENPELMEKV